jgi:phage terminase small subunit
LKNSSTPKPPPGLSIEAKRLWTSLREQYDIDDVAGLLLLATAMQSFSRADRARAIVDKEGECVRDRWGQSKVNPACAVERDARAAMLTALRALRLDVGDGDHD